MASSGVAEAGAGEIQLPCPDVSSISGVSLQVKSTTHRFDRRSGRRIHTHTFGNLIQADFRVPSSDYADLLKVTSLLTRNNDDINRAFHRAVFNVLAHNRDDHVKNFAFCLDDETGQWSLSPAYDLTFSTGPVGQHSLTVLGEGRRPEPSHLSALAVAAGLKRRIATTVLEKVRASVRRWLEHAERAGVPEATALSIWASLRPHLD